MRISDWSSDVCSSDLHYGLFRKARSNFEQWMMNVVSHTSGSISHQRCASFRTPGPMSAAPFRDSRRQMLPDTTKGNVMGKLEGTVAVITGDSSARALASARRSVEEGAHGFLKGARQETRANADD